MRNGYETSALIPMRLGGHTFGLLQFEDTRPGMLSREMLSALEAVAVNLALALSQRRYAEELREEIGRREFIERRTQANNQVLRLMTEASDRQDFLDGIVKLVHEWTGSRCVGIRMLDSEGNIPYGSYMGFSREFWEKENWLSVAKDTCACTRVIAGEPDPQDVRCMTANGSFVVNDSMRFLGELQGVELTRFRGACIDSGFSSIAIFPIRENGRIMGGIHITDERPGMLPDSCVDLLEGLSRLMGEAIVKFNARDALDRQKELIQNIVDRIPVMLCFFNPSGTLQFVNPEFERVFGWRLEEIQKDPLSRWFSDPQYCEGVRQYMKEATVEWRDFMACTKKGEQIETSWSNVRLTDGSLIGIGIDLRERKRAQTAMERANRALRVLSETNYSLVQEHEEGELLHRVCRIIAETGGYALAWVGYPEEGEEKRVIPVAKCGRAVDYLDSIRVSWADSPFGQGPVGKTIREGKPQIARDFGSEAQLSPWRELALSHGLQSNVTFPLIIHGEVIGALAIYASKGETIHDHEEEVQLLGSLAGNLAYGIDAIRLHKEHELAVEELKSYMKRLQASNQALQDFASIASHDMQEPLRKVASFGNMLEHKYGPALGEEGKDFLARMLHATDRMQTLLTSLLDYSRVTSRAEPFRRVELSKIIREVLSDLEVRIASTGGEVVLGELPEVHADPNQMRQLFQNLIGNGLKFHKRAIRLLGSSASRIKAGLARSPLRTTA
ncbi:MAG: GAF domain-containing protein [Acidobacteriota bacterium]